MTINKVKTEEIWTVLHDRSKARNGIDPEYAEAPQEAFKKFNASHAKVGVFYRAGGAFCAGWDLKYAQTLKESSNDDLHKLDFPLVSAEPPRSPLGQSRSELDKSVIASIEGLAVAGGMELALWCDKRIMAEDAYLRLYCFRCVIPLLHGGTIQLPRLVGERQALEIALTGCKVTAQECYQIGLCDKIVKSVDTRKEAERMAQEIARFTHSAALADRRTIIESGD